MKPTVLVVDDETSMRLLLQDLLADDYHVVPAVNSYQALSLMANGHPRIDLINEKAPLR